MRFKHIRLGRTVLSTAIAAALGTGNAYGVGPTCLGSFSHLTADLVSYGFAGTNGASGGVVTVADIGTGVGNNFTMLTPTGGAWGGENGITACWDGTQNTSASSTNFNISILPNTLFSGYMWTAHHIRLFGPGTYTIDTTCTTAQLEAGISACNGPLDVVHFQPEARRYYTLTVGAGQLGAHMLFDWNGNTDIDVINVWQAGSFSPSPMQTAGGGNSGTSWNQMSIDIDSDGINGKPMFDGPFSNWNANFNLMMPARPDAVNDSTSTNEGSTKLVSVTSNDIAYSTSAAFSVSGAASHGTCAVSGSQISYTPAVGYVGADSCQYTIGSSAGYSVTDSATVSITVNNVAPTASTKNFTTAFNTAANNVQLNYSDPGTDIDVTTVTLSDSDGGTAGNQTAQGGTVVDNDDGTINYTPPVGFDGTDTFTFTISDTHGGTSGSATVTATVLPSGAVVPPTAADDSDVTARITPVTIDLLANDTAGDNAIDPTAVTLSDSDGGTAGNQTAQGGTVVDNNDGTVTYTPPTGFAGDDTFTYTVADTAANASNTATVTVTVTNVGPTANDDDADTQQGTPVDIDVTDNDTDDSAIDATTVTITDDADHGTTSVNAVTGVVTYDPADDFTGTDTFTYTVDDDGNPVETSDAATVSVTVTASGVASSDGTVAGGSSDTDDDGIVTYQQVLDGGADPDDDMQVQCVGGCFDFVVSGVTDSAVTMVLPLSAPIPDVRSDRIHYRKWNGTAWVNFVSGDDNGLASAPANPDDTCPAAGDVSYEAGLNAGDECLELTIVDNGDFDNDPALGTVSDPGGIGYTTPGTIPTPESGVNAGGVGGCSVNDQATPSQHAEWWLVGGFLAWLGTLVRRSHRS